MKTDICSRENVTYLVRCMQISGYHSYLPDYKSDDLFLFKPSDSQLGLKTFEALLNLQLLYILLLLTPLRPEVPYSIKG